MPGSKRRIDEDRWLEKQLKKFKFSQVDANVYASTLAKLRQGSRQLFMKLQEADIQMDTSASTTASIGAGSAGSPGSVNDSTATSEDGMNADILTDGEEMMEATSVSLCEDCSTRFRSSVSGSGRNEPLLLKCCYCEKNVCHLNQCKACASAFCSSCSIARYDEPSQDTFICISCLNKSH